MSEQKFKLALCQIDTLPEKSDTMDKAERMVREAAEKGANVVALPEMFACPYAKGYFDRFAENADGESVHRMAYWAKEYGVLLVGGSIPERDGNKLYNTCFVFDRQGAVIAKHRKTHLFDVDIKGGVCFRESKHFAPGDDICVFDTEYGRMGVAICFDMRFPELIRAMAKRGPRSSSCPPSSTQLPAPHTGNSPSGCGPWTTSCFSPVPRRRDRRIFSISAGGTPPWQGPLATYWRQATKRSRLYSATLTFRRSGGYGRSFPPFCAFGRICIP